MAKRQAKTSIQAGILKIIGSQPVIDTETVKDLAIASFSKKSAPQAKKTPFTYSVQRSLDTLLSNGDITQVSPTQIALSDKGRQKLQNQSFDLATSVVPTIWDGKWRIVLLDFPEYQKQDRDTMRYLLKKARFVCLKKSVWISPFPYEEYVHSLKQSLPSKDAVICMVAETIDADVEEKLLEHFRLARQ